MLTKVFIQYTTSVATINWEAIYLNAEKLKVVNHLVTP